MKSKKAAMEMSVGTIVTIVLLMSVLILGIFLVQKIFKGSTNAIDSINTEVENQINKLFSDEGGKIAFYPTSRDLVLKKSEEPKGFAFSVRNANNPNSAEFSYTIKASDVSKCGTLTKEEASSYLLGGSGEFSLPSGGTLDMPRLVKFILPDTAPACTMIYYIEVKRDGEPYTGADIAVTIK